jgi:hypothetical protein
MRFVRFSAGRARTGAPRDVRAPAAATFADTDDRPGDDVPAPRGERGRESLGLVVESAGDDLYGARELPALVGRQAAGAHRLRPLAARAAARARVSAAVTDIAAAARRLDLRGLPAAAERNPLVDCQVASHERLAGEVAELADLLRGQVSRAGRGQSVEPDLLAQSEPVPTGALGRGGTGSD